MRGAGQTYFSQVVSLLLSLLPLLLFYLLLLLLLLVLSLLLLLLLVLLLVLLLLLLLLLLVVSKVKSQTQMQGGGEKYTHGADAARGRFLPYLADVCILPHKHDTTLSPFTFNFLDLSLLFLLRMKRDKIHHLKHYTLSIYMLFFPPSLPPSLPP